MSVAMLMVRVNGSMNVSGVGVDVFIGDRQSPGAQDDEKRVQLLHLSQGGLQCLQQVTASVWPQLQDPLTDLS